MIPENNRINHIAIASQVLSYYIQDMKANHWFKGVLLNFANKFIEKLKETEWKYFDKMYSQEEEAAVVVYETYDSFIKTVSNIPIWEMNNITEILIAYQADPKSVEGIVRKINKYKL